MLMQSYVKRLKNKMIAEIINLVFAVIDKALYIARNIFWEISQISLAVSVLQATKSPKFSAPSAPNVKESESRWFQTETGVWDPKF